MRPISLFIENFLSFQETVLDFSNINSALIIGKISNSELESNGAGKSTIFRAFEYVLFNQVKDVNLEKLIRDNSTFCRIGYTFAIDDKIYRIFRSRTKKSVSDFSLYERNTNPAKDIDALSYYLKPEEVKLYWDTKTSRRTQDSEEDLFKLIKTNYKSFLNTVYFVQHDFNTGLAATSPENRKKILKESFQLNIYSKLEKIAKEKYNALQLSHSQKKLLLKSNKNSEELSNGLKQLNLQHNKISEEINELSLKINEIDTLPLINELQELNSLFTKLSSNNNILIKNKNSLTNELQKLEKSEQEISIKRKSAIDYAKNLQQELLSLKDNINNLLIKNIDQQELLSLTEQITENNTHINSKTIELEELKIPFPEEGVCKHCRQPLTDTHRRACLENIQNSINRLSKEISERKQLNKELSSKQISLNKEIKENELLKNKKSQLEKSLLTKEQEFISKKKLYEEYSDNLKQVKASIKEVQEKIQEVSKEIQDSSIDEQKKVEKKINDKKSEIKNIEVKIQNYKNSIQDLKVSKEIIVHKILEDDENIIQAKLIEEEISVLEQTLSLYPDVIYGFSSKGIPAVIIQNILDDLQIEANKVLSKLMPSLQLAFKIEKTKSDGEQDDTLDIVYYLNNRERDYVLLSGAMKLIVMFALKLGLAYLNQNLFGSNIKLLLLDEVDQALDKARIDEYSDIIKILQKEFLVLVITHNDRLKDKFSNIIQVELDQNLISKAQLISR